MGLERLSGPVQTYPNIPPVLKKKKKTRVHKKHVDRFRPYTGKQLNGGISIAFLTEHA